MARITYIKIFGRQRTGTTFFRALCTQNFNGVRVFNNQFGWKHGLPLDEKKLKEWVNRYKPYKRKFKLHTSSLEDILCGNKMYPFVIIKNPYSWYWSIRKWVGDNVNVKKQYTIYNNRYRVYKELCEGRLYPEVYYPGTIMKYEDLIDHPSRVLKNISKQTGCGLNQKIKIPIQVEQSSRFTEERRQFYLSSGTFGLSKKIIDEVNGLVDWDLMRYYGYERRSI
jgi:hypothetical protein